MATIGTMAFTTPGIRDGIAKEEEVNIATLCNADKSFMPFFPAFISRHGFGGCIFLLGILGRSNRNERRNNRTQES